MIDCTQDNISTIRTFDTEPRDVVITWIEVIAKVAWSKSTFEPNNGSRSGLYEWGLDSQTVLHLLSQPS